MSTATPQDVQAKIDAAIVCLKKTTSSGSKTINQYGTDWTKWPTNSNWYQAFSSLYAARTEAGHLVANTLTAAFVSKEV